MKKKREKCDLGAKIDKIIRECNNPYYSYSRVLRGEAVEQAVLHRSYEVSRHLKSHFHGTMGLWYRPFVNIYAMSPNEKTD